MQSTKPIEKKEFPIKYKILFLSIVILVLISLFLAGLVPRLNAWKHLEEAAQLHDSIFVNIMELEQGKRPIELVLPSTTQALRVTPIWSRIDGYIKNFYVDIGDSVEEGQLILEIDTPEVEQQLSQAKADLSMALAKLDIAKISASRWQDLFGINAEAVSPQEVDEKTSGLQAVIAEVESSQANVQRLEKIHGFNRLYAPFKGIITERNIDIGTLVTAGSQSNYQQLFQLAKTDIIRVFASVPQTYFRLIRVGDEVDVFIQEFPERVFKGIIARTSRSLDPAARTLLTEIHVNNEDGDLITGLYAVVHFNLISHSPYFIIPTAALIIRDGHPQVALVDEGGIVRLQEVRIGRDFGKSVEITAGLKENEKMIANPTDRIRNGMQLNLKDCNLIPCLE